MTDTATVKKLERMALQLRFDLLDILGVGKVGHLGGSSSMAEIVACLYFHVMRYDPKNPKDPDRDRFLLSKGHCVLIQYAALAELGVVPRAELKKVKTLAGCLQGHPDMDRTPGIEAVTGSLGMGLSIGLGMALGFRLDRRPSRVYVVMGDGELSEGQIWEAAMAAAAFKVDNLTGVVDLNHVQATGPTREIFDIPEIARKWAAFGWEVLNIDGHDVSQILTALNKAQKTKGRPTVIVAETVKGKGFSFAENNAAFHNSALTADQYRQALSELEARRTALA
ncbi:MAG: transketolase [Deltaproteobacteria bacterium]|nr:transketolase [Deltaproteobacteria bacterium]